MSETNSPRMMDRGRSRSRSNEHEKEENKNSNATSNNSSNNNNHHNNSHYSQPHFTSTDTIPLPQPSSSEQKRVFDEEPKLANMNERAIRDAPNNVLFVRNFPTGLSEFQLETLFKDQRDFVELRKVKGKWFVEYKSIESATKAMTILQVYRASPQDKALFIEYDRGKKRRFDDRDDDRERPAKSERRSHRSRDRDDRDRRDRSRSHSKERDDRRDDRDRRDRSRSKERDDRRDDRDRRDRSRSKERDDRRDKRDRDHRDRRSDYSDRDHGRSYGYSEYYQQRSSSGYPYPVQSSEPNRGPPSTIFVGNLPRDITERELSLIFRLNPCGMGYKGGRIICPRESRGNIYAFVDFYDTASATYCVENLQGFKLDSRDREGLLLEFDRNGNRRS